MGKRNKQSDDARVLHFFTRVIEPLKSINGKMVSINLTEKSVEVKNSVANLSKYCRILKQLGKIQNVQERKVGQDLFATITF